MGGFEKSFHAFGDYLWESSTKVFPKLLDRRKGETLPKFFDSWFSPGYLLYLWGGEKPSKMFGD